MDGGPEYGNLSEQGVGGRLWMGEFAFGRGVLCYISRNWPSLEGQQGPNTSKHQKLLIITDPDCGRVLRDGL